LLSRTTKFIPSKSKLATPLTHKHSIKNWSIILRSARIARNHHKNPSSSNQRSWSPRGAPRADPEEEQGCQEGGARLPAEQERSRRIELPEDQLEEKEKGTRSEI
jgi:hypothetical protein